MRDDIWDNQNMYAAMYVVFERISSNNSHIEFFAWSDRWWYFNHYEWVLKTIRLFAGVRYRSRPLLRILLKRPLLLFLRCAAIPFHCLVILRLAGGFPPAFHGDNSTGFAWWQCRRIAISWKERLSLCLSFLYSSWRSFFSFVIDRFVPAPHILLRLRDDAYLCFRSKKMPCDNRKSAVISKVSLRSAESCLCETYLNNKIQ